VHWLLWSVHSCCSKNQPTNLRPRTDVLCGCVGRIQRATAAIWNGASKSLGAQLSRHCASAWRLCQCAAGVRHGRRGLCYVVNPINRPDYLLLLHQTHERTNTAAATASFMLAFSRPYLYVKFLLYH